MQDKRIIESRIVQEFKGSNFWRVFEETLQKDWQEIHVLLRSADPSKIVEVAKLQAKLEYIQEILDMFNTKANYEIQLKQLEQEAIEANDY